MSEQPPNEQPPNDRRRTPRARVHVAKWSPWVWVVPALAIFLAGYLVVRYGLFGGGDITVRFLDARGLDRYSPVRFRGAKVGTVQKITIDKDLKTVVVRISMDASMSHALNSGTKFWIDEPGLSGGVGGLLAGTSIGIAPGQGDSASEFLGQEYPPVLPATQDGKTFILAAHGLGSLAAGSPVEYQGMRVGTVLGAEYDDRSHLTLVHAFVVKRFADNVRESTRFWRAGGLNISLSGGGVSMAGGLTSLLTAPVAFTTPEVLPGAPVPNGTRFDLYESEGAAQAAADGPQLTYVTYFPGSVGGLVPGTAVNMRGVLVGRVRDVSLRYVPQTASLETPVTIEIDPRKLQLPVSDATSREELRATMNDALGKLVQKGMRATLATSLVLPGASGVGLDVVAKPGTARLAVEHDPPIIPAAAGGSGLEGALSAVNDIAARVRNLPIEEITGHLRSTAARIDSLVHDPALDQSLQRMNASLADVEKVTAAARENAGPILRSARNAASSAESAAKTVNDNVAPIVQSLRNTAAAAEQAAGRANQLLGSTSHQNYDLGTLIKELTRAAMSVRALADYLDENPDALLKGRGK